jgi:hypothetical protein
MAELCKIWFNKNVEPRFVWGEGYFVVVVGGLVLKPNLVLYFGAMHAFRFKSLGHQRLGTFSKCYRFFILMASLNFLYIATPN